jgi:hypothetical protein
MYLDIDERKMRRFNFLLLLKMFGDKGVWYRRTRHGYHFYLPVECTADNFVYCLTLRVMLGDDPNRIAHDIKRLDLECFYQNFDVTFDMKIRKKIYRVSPWVKLPV